MSPRAPALPPDERRRTIVKATLPLLRAKGLTVSTAEIARAAGVAEGTLFRVFETKDDIIDAVIEHVMDPDPTIEALARIPAREPLTQRVRRVIELWHARVAEISVLMAALHAGGESGHRHPSKSHHQHADHMNRLNEAVAGVLAPDAHRLRLGVTETASLLRSMAFASAHPLLSDRLVTDPAILVDLFLHGALAGESDSVHPEETGPCCSA